MRHKFTPVKHIYSIRRHWDKVTGKDLTEGKDWYPRARSLVFELSMAFGTTEEIVAGVLAALSQRCRWSTNIDRATRVLDGDRHPGGLPAAADKALAIMNGADPVEALGARAHKIQAFYQALLGDDDAAVIDTWILDALSFEKFNKQGVRYQSYTPLQYQKLADVLRAEAKRVGLAVTEYQAAVWIQIRGAAQ